MQPGESSNRTLEVNLVRALNYIRKTGLMPDSSPCRCILCNHLMLPGEDAGISVFFPADHQRFSGKADEGAALIYALCGSCFEFEDRDERVEEILYREASLQ